MFLFRNSISIIHTGGMWYFHSIVPNQLNYLDWVLMEHLCCEQVGSIAGFALIIIIAVVGGVLYQSSWTIAPSLWIIGTIYPFIGCSLGFFLARFVGQPWYRWGDTKMFLTPLHLKFDLLMRFVIVPLFVQMSNHCTGDRYPECPVVQHYRPTVLQPRGAGNHVCLPPHLQHLPARVSTRLCGM